MSLLSTLESSLMNAPILVTEKEPTFNLPAGHYPATVLSIAVSNQLDNETLEKEVIVFFEVHDTGIEDETPVAGCTYRWNVGEESDLQSFLRTLTNPDWFLLMAGQKLDLDELIGMEVELELIHEQEPNKKEPEVLIANIRPMRNEWQQAA